MPFGGQKPSFGGDIEEKSSQGWYIVSYPRIGGLTTYHSHARSAKKRERRLCLVDGWIGNRCVHISKPTLATFSFISGNNTACPIIDTFSQSFVDFHFNSVLVDSLQK